MTIEEPKQFQLCTIKVIVPVESNDEAMRIKNHIDAVFATHDKAKVDFNLMSLPKGLENPFTPPFKKLPEHSG